MLTITHVQWKGYSVGSPHGVDVGQDGSLNGINHLVQIYKLYFKKYLFGSIGSTRNRVTKKFKAVTRPYLVFGLLGLTRILPV